MPENNADILVVDNYDSFAYNLVQYVGEIADTITVRRNDEVSINEIMELDPDGIVVSPGPGTPQEAGVSIPIFADTEYPALGVCLGHQALCAAYGAPVGHAPNVVHGKPSVVETRADGLFSDVPNQLQVGRYHSLAITPTALPDALRETAWTVGDKQSLLMGVRHRQKPQFGVQFHPESILTGRVTETNQGSISLAVGKQLIKTFCHIATRYS